MKVIMSNVANQDIDSIFEYISKDSIKYAINNEINIRLVINKLEHYPYIGRYVPELTIKVIENLFIKIIE